MTKTRHNSIFLTIRKAIAAKWLFFLGMALCVISTLFQLAIPSVMGKLLNVNCIRYLTWHPIYIFLGGLTFVIIYFLQGCATYMLGAVGADSLINLQDEYVRHVFRLPFSEINKLSAGDLSSGLTNDLSEVIKVITTVIPQMLLNSLMLLGSLAMLFVIDWKLTLLSLSVLPFMILIVVPLNRIIENLYHRHQTILGKINGNFTQKFSKITTLKSFLAENEEIKYENKLFVSLSHNMKKVLLVMSSSNALSNMLMILAAVFILLFGGIAVLKHRLTFGLLMTFILYMMQAIEPGISILESFSELAESQGALNRVASIFDIPEEIQEGNLNNSIITHGNIEFRDVSFSYDGENNVLQHVNLCIPTNKTIVIVGPSGSGKTTMLSLLMKFYDNFSGDILIDGSSVKNMSSSSIRRQVSYVTQNSELFKGTIKQNILLGKNSKYLKNIQSALSVSGFEGVLSELPDKMQYLLGDDGVGLSEGQKQRLNIARALISQPKILLMDEMTANLDNVSENSILESLNMLKGHMTIVIVAHRLETIKNADIICVLENDGTVQWTGTHNYLMEHSDTYRALFKHSNLIFSN